MKLVFCSAVRQLRDQSQQWILGRTKSIPAKSSHDLIPKAAEYAFVLHVFLRLCQGDVKLKRRIVFKKRNPGDSPTAEFENEQESMDPWHVSCVVLKGQSGRN